MTVEKGQTAYLDLGFKTLGQAPVTLAWPRVFTPQTSKNYPASAPTFAARLLLRPDHPQYGEFLGAVLDVASANYQGVVTPDRQPAIIDPKMFSWPFKLGQAIAEEGRRSNPPKDYQAFAPYLAFRTTSGKEVPLGYYDDAGNPVDIPVAGEAGRNECRKLFFGGADVCVKVGIRPMKERSGVVIYLNMLGSYRTGTAVASFGSSEEAKRSFSGMHTAHVPSTAGIVQRGSPYAGAPMPPPPAQPGMGVRY